jgi:hypothetical protein
MDGCSNSEIIRLLVARHNNMRFEVFMAESIQITVFLTLLILVRHTSNYYRKFNNTVDCDW